jgi:hypothetical protein
MRFRRKPVRDVEAEQFIPGKDLPQGVTSEVDAMMRPHYYVNHRLGARTEIFEGDWVCTDVDGGYYVIKRNVMNHDYELIIPKPVVSATPGIGDPVISGAK